MDEFEHAWYIAMLIFFGVIFASFILISVVLSALTGGL
jgi:hypothetical protein